MKKILIGSANKCLLLFLFICGQVKLWAQDTTTSSTVNTAVNKAEDFFSQPWVWVAGGILLLLIIGALVSGKSKKHRLVTKTTVIKERLE